MDALIASAGPIHRPKAGPSKPRKVAPHKTIDRGPNKEAIDLSTHSILPSTRLPSSFHRNALPGAEEPIRPEKNISKIKDKKLRAKVGRNDINTKQAKQDRAEVNEWLNHATSGGAGEIEVDEDIGEKTWRVGQEEIKREVGVASSKKKFDLRLEDMGDYFVDYSRNGRWVEHPKNLDES